jgi:hypothetical protein
VTDAPVPVSHTPVIYVKGGGSAMFSARCRQLLIDAGLDPDAFGSYEQTRDQIQNARTRTEPWDDAVRNNRPTEGLVEPTDEDRALTGSNASHLISSRAQLQGREEGGDRPRRIVFEDPARAARGEFSPSRVIHDPCRNQVAGYVDREAPAMIMPNDLEQRVGQREDQQAQAQIDRSGGGREAPYPGPQRRTDENERADLVVNDLNARNAGATDPTALGTGAPGAGNNASAQIAETAAVDGQDPNAPNAPADNEVNGESAAECVKNFIRMKEAEMKTDGVDREIARLQAESANAPQVAPVREAQRQAQADLAAATARRDAAQQAATEAADRERAARGPFPAGPDRQARIDAHAEARRQQGEANAALAAENRAVQQSQAAATQAQQRLDAAEYQYGAADQAQAHIRCLEDQRAQILAGGANVPANLDTGRAVLPGGE